MSIISTILETMSTFGHAERDCKQFLKPNHQQCTNLVRLLIQNGQVSTINSALPQFFLLLILQGFQTGQKRNLDNTVYTTGIRKTIYERIIYKTFIAARFVSPICPFTTIQFPY